MKINIITLGKLKEKYLQNAEAEYLKRLGIFCKLNIIELKEESFSEKVKPEIIKQKEAEKILKHLPQNAFVISLDETGQQLTSPEFSKKLENLENIEQVENLVFIIGGPLGLDKSIIKKSDLILSLSKMTFTHQMVRIFLLEQIYRAFMISKNRKYHY